MSVMYGECFGKDNLVCVVGNGENTLFWRHFCWRVVLLAKVFHGFIVFLMFKMSLLRINLDYGSGL